MALLPPLDPILPQITAATLALAGERTDIALALGGGGARGLAHILILEAFDELGLKPKAISGTSIVRVSGSRASAIGGAGVR